MKALKVMKRLAAGVCVVAAVAAVSMPSKAQALGFPSGDLAFIIYGGGSEFYKDMGSISSILSAPTTTLNLTAQQLSDVTTGASLGIKFTLLGTSADGASFLTGSSSNPITAAQKSTTDWVTGQGQVQSWGNLLGAATGGTTANNPLTLLASNASSFTNALGTDGRLSGTMGFSVAQAADGTLSLFQIMTNAVTGADVYTRVASAVLTSQGQLTITSVAAVPIPAAVVLFGTGLVALVGIARRKIMDRAA